MTLKEELQKINEESSITATERALSEFREDLPNHIENLKELARKGVMHVDFMSMPKAFNRNESNKFYGAYNELVANWMNENFGTMKQSGRFPCSTHYWEIL